jgi:hypothetical protein
MRQTLFVQNMECLFDIGIDPGFFAVWLPLRAAIDNLGKFCVRSYFKPVFADGFGKRAGKMKTFKR